MILADTHTAIWLTCDRQLLSQAATEALTSERNEGGIAISGITLWEVALLATRNSLSIDKTLSAYLEHLESIFIVLPVNGRIGLRATQFTKVYPRDPADRLIGATALVHGLRLVTADRAIKASGEVPVVW